MAALTFPRCCGRTVQASGSSSGSGHEKSKRHVSFAALSSVYRSRGPVIVLSPTCGLKLSNVHPDLNVETGTSSLSGEIVALATTSTAKNEASLLSPNHPMENRLADNSPSELDMIRLERAISSKACTEKNGNEDYTRLPRDGNTIFTHSSDYGKRNDHNMASINHIGVPKENGQDPNTSFSFTGDSADDGQSCKDVVVAVRSTRRSRKCIRKEQASEESDKNTSSSLTRVGRKDSQIVQKTAPTQKNLPRTRRNRSRLLTSSEMAEVAHGTKDLLALEEMQRGFTKQMGRMPTMSELAKAAGVDLETLKNRLNRGQQCKKTMMQYNHRLVISIAKRYQGIGLTMEDLVQKGNTGLIKGCEKFDPERGFRFSTYACWWIRQAILEGIAEHSRMLRLPKHIYDAFMRIRHAIRILTAEHGRSPKEKEIAEVVEMSVEGVRTIMRAGKCNKSLDFAIGPDKNIKLKDIIADTGSESSEAMVNRRLARTELRIILSALTIREREVVYLRYGIDDGKWRSFDDVGKEMGISRERVRQLDLKAIRKLRQPEFSNGLSVFFSD